MRDAAHERFLFAGHGEEPECLVGPGAIRDKTRSLKGCLLGGGSGRILAEPRIQPFVPLRGESVAQLDIREECGVATVEVSKYAEVDIRAQPLDGTGVYLDGYGPITRSASLDSSAPAAASPPTSYRENHTARCATRKLRIGSGASQLAKAADRDARSDEGGLTVNLLT